jgi:hypothetical protein
MQARFSGQRVLAIENDGANAASNDVGIKIDAAVIEDRVSPSQWFKA